MKSYPSLFRATCRFEAARKLDLPCPNPSLRALHGHGFIVSVLADMPENASIYPGGQALQLQQSLQGHASTLDYAFLNETIADPTDANIGLWMHDKLAQLNVKRVLVQSTPTRGVEIDADKTVFLWRKYRFHAAHQLPNVPAGHKCGRMHGHGFQVLLHVQEKDHQGVTLTHGDLDTCWAPLSRQLDYHCLNDIAGLSNPTSEILSSWIWGKLSPALPQLKWVTVYETASCGSIFDGKQYRIWKDTTIDSAVQFQCAPASNPRAAIHGDTYTVRLMLSAALDSEMGWTIDFGDVKTLFDPIFKSLDHQPLYERAEFREGDTASIGNYVLGQMKTECPYITGVQVMGSDGVGTILDSNSLGPGLPD